MKCDKFLSVCRVFFYNKLPKTKKKKTYFKHMLGFEL